MVKQYVKDPSTNKYKLVEKDTGTTKLSDIGTAASENGLSPEQLAARIKVLEDLFFANITNSKGNFTKTEGKIKK